MFRSLGGVGFDGIGPLQFNYPGGITVHPTTGQIFVADSWNRGCITRQ